MCRLLSARWEISLPAGFIEYAPVRSLPICVNPGSAFTCCWIMPFRKGFRITLENRTSSDERIYYQITYIRKPVSETAGYFHAQFRREKPLKYQKDFRCWITFMGEASM